MKLVRAGERRVLPRAGNVLMSEPSPTSGLVFEPEKEIAREHIQGALLELNRFLDRVRSEDQIMDGGRMKDKLDNLSNFLDAFPEQRPLLRLDTVVQEKIKSWIMEQVKAWLANPSKTDRNAIFLLKDLLHIFPEEGPVVPPEMFEKMPKPLATDDVYTQLVDLVSIYEFFPERRSELNISGDLWDKTVAKIQIEMEDREYHFSHLLYAKNLRILFPEREFETDFTRKIFEGALNDVRSMVGITAAGLLRVVIAPRVRLVGPGHIVLDEPASLATSKPLPPRSTL